MNADLEKIRKARLFQQLPERAFVKITPLVKVRAYTSGEEALNYKTNGEFQNYFGYVVRGRILFLAEDGSPLGIAAQDEFFLGKSFLLNDRAVHRLLSAAETTLVVFIPKNVISVISTASRAFGDMLEDIYDSIYERSKLIAQDSSAPKTIQQWIMNPESQKTLGGWVELIEKKRHQAIEKKAKEQKFRRIYYFIWAVGAVFAGLLTVESLGRYGESGLTFVHRFIPYFELDKFEPGTRWNIFLGILGYTFIALTYLHTTVKWGIRKFKWKINFQMSQQLHMFFGILGSYIVVLHTGFHLEGANVAYWALYAVMIGLFTGFVGQFISSQIPKTIRGEKVKLDALKAEQEKLQQKAEMLMSDDRMYKTSVLLISKGVSSSFWGNLLSMPLLWLRAQKVKGELQNLGLGDRGAALAADLIRKEYQLKQKVKFLEMSNGIFKRWMLIHKPIGWAVYLLGAVHIILVLLSI